MLYLLIPWIAAAYATIASDMVDQWYNDPNHSHGFLVPIISGYFLLKKKAELNASPVRPSNLGLLVILASQVLLVVGIVLYSVRLVGAQGPGPAPAHRLSGLYGAAALHRL